MALPTCSCLRCGAHRRWCASRRQVDTVLAMDPAVLASTIKSAYTRTLVSVIDGVDGYTPDMLRRRGAPTSDTRPLVDAAVLAVDPAPTAPWPDPVVATD
jgi:hypothetical protein